MTNRCKIVALLVVASLAATGCSTGSSGSRSKVPVNQTSTSQANGGQGSVP